MIDAKTKSILYKYVSLKLGFWELIDLLSGWETLNEDFKKLPKEEQDYFEHLAKS